MQTFVPGAINCSNDSIVCSAMSDCPALAEPLIFYNNPSRLPTDASATDMLSTYYKENRVSTATLHQSTTANMSTNVEVTSASALNAASSMAGLGTATHDITPTPKLPSASVTALPHPASGVGLRTGIGVGVGITLLAAVTIALFLVRRARQRSEYRIRRTEPVPKISTDCDQHTLNSTTASSMPFSPLSNYTLWQDELCRFLGTHELDSVKGVHELDDPTVAELPA